MAKKFNFDVKCAEDVLKAFKEWSAFDEAKRAKLVEKAGGEKGSYTVDTGIAKVVFYAESGKIWIGYKPLKKDGSFSEKVGKNHTLTLTPQTEGGLEHPIEVFISKDGKRTPVHKTWTADTSLWYSVQNDGLMKSLNAAF